MGRPSNNCSSAQVIQPHNQTINKEEPSGKIIWEDPPKQWRAKKKTNKFRSACTSPLHLPRHAQPSCRGKTGKGNKPLGRFQGLPFSQGFFFPPRSARDRFLLTRQQRSMRMFVYLRVYTRVSTHTPVRVLLARAHAADVAFRATAIEPTMLATSPDRVWLGPRAFWQDPQP